MLTISNLKAINFGKDGKAAVLINNSYDIENNCAIVILEKNNDCGEIGNVSADNLREHIENAVSLNFYDSKSIDALIDRLQMAKQVLVDEGYRNEFLSKCK